jgi:chromosome partitioning protein
LTVIAVINHKGGVGKTTTTVNLGAALQEIGKRVRLIDLDPQASLTVHLGLRQPDALSATVADALEAKIASKASPNLLDIVNKSPAGIDLIPANRQLALTETLLGSRQGWAHVLRECLDDVHGRYDYILIDCLPGQNFLVYNGITASDAILIPLQADYLAVQGLALTFRTAVTVKQQYNPRIVVLGILLTMLDLRTAHNKQIAGVVKRAFEGKVRVFDTIIREAVGFKESSKAGVSVLRLNPGSLAAMSYRSLANEVVTSSEQLQLLNSIKNDEITAKEAGQLQEAASVALAQAESMIRERGAQVVRARGSRGLTSRLRTGNAEDSASDATDTAFLQMPDDLSRRLSEEAGQSVLSATTVKRPVTPVPSPAQRRANPTETCPQLGLASKHEEKSSGPSEEHRCCAEEAEQSIDLATQQSTCLQSWYMYCPRYLRYQQNLAAELRSKPSIFGRLSSIFRSSR